MLLDNIKIQIHCCCLIWLLLSLIIGKLRNFFQIIVDSIVIKNIFQFPEFLKDVINIVLNEIFLYNEEKLKLVEVLNLNAIISTSCREKKFYNTLFVVLNFMNAGSRILELIFCVLGNKVIKIKANKTLIQ